MYTLMDCASVIVYNLSKQWHNPLKQIWEMKFLHCEDVKQKNNFIGSDTIL